MIPKQLAKFCKLIVRFNLGFCRPGRPTSRQYFFPSKSGGAKVTSVTGAASHLFKSVISLVSILSSGPNLKRSFPKGKGLGVLAAVTGFFGGLRSTSASITVTVSPVKKIGCLVKGITARLLSNSPTCSQKCRFLTMTSGQEARPEVLNS
jgi:hypothetical protein